MTSPNCPLWEHCFLCQNHFRHQGLLVHVCGEDTPPAVGGAECEQYRPVYKSHRAARRNKLCVFSDRAGDARSAFISLSAGNNDSEILHNPTQHQGIIWIISGFTDVHVMDQVLGSGYLLMLPGVLELYRLL